MGKMDHLRREFLGAFSRSTRQQAALEQTLAPSGFHCSRAASVVYDGIGSAGRGCMIGKRNGLTGLSRTRVYALEESRAVKLSRRPTVCPGQLLTEQLNDDLGEVSQEFS